MDLVKIILILLLIPCHHAFRDIKTCRPRITTMKLSNTIIDFRLTESFPSSIVAGIAAASLVAIPASIQLDKWLQKGTTRIRQIANYKCTINNPQDGGKERELFAYLARPKVSATSVKRPVVILIHQFFGLTKRDTELADELARYGYFTIAPDCFQGQTTSVIPRAISFVSKAAYQDDWDINFRDLRAIVQHLQSTCSKWANFDEIVVAGFCFGGGLALRYADLFPENVTATAVFYGKPLKNLTGYSPSCDFYGVYGDNDRQFPPAAVNDLETLLKSKVDNAQRIEIRRYPGKAHAFVEDLASIKNGGDTGDAWSGFLRLLERKCPQIEKNREWGQSLGGCDVCASKLNDDPFGVEDKQPDAWDEMKRRIEDIEKRTALEDNFFLQNEGFIL